MQKEGLTLQSGLAHLKVKCVEMLTSSLLTPGAPLDLHPCLALAQSPSCFFFFRPSSHLHYGWFI